MLPPKEVLEATRRRFEEREALQAETKARIREGEILSVNEPERLAIRTARLMANPNVMPKLVAGAVLGRGVSEKSLERVLSANNLIDVWFFDAGEKAAGTVGRITVNDSRGQGYGTGFLVAPRLLLTNNHVLPVADSARGSFVEFAYERRPDGSLRSPVAFELRPDLLFITDEALDFALVAVAELDKTEGKAKLSDFPFNPVTTAQGKIALGECINIIQHPNGEPKKLALQDNKLMDLLEDFLQYETDTMPGSSGSPLFNNQWEIVGLHHSGVMETDANGNPLSIDGGPWDESMGEDRIKWKANEGIRISRIIEFARGERSKQTPAGQALLDDMLAPSALPSTTPLQPVELSPRAQPAVPAMPTGEVSFTIPLHVTVRLGQPETSAVPAAGQPERPAPAFVEEAIRLKPPFVERPYDKRAGYDRTHLGVDVPLPEVTEEGLVSKLQDGSWAIPYEHFSVVLHRTRRMPLFTASNLNADASARRPEPGRDYTRKGLTGLAENEAEQWLLDPRVPAQDQLPDIFFTKDGGAFDKGHIVRREDMCWGTSYQQVRRANGDTFHVTNCSPQTKQFNQSAAGVDNWGDLENEISKQLGQSKLTLFAGPLFDSADLRFRGRDDLGEVAIQIPSRYWKVVVSAEGDTVRAYAFLLEQDLKGVPLEFDPGAKWRKFMVRLSDLQERLVGFKFPKVIMDGDQFGAQGEELARRMSVERLESRAAVP